jgi:hypothetical protein
MNRSEVVWTKQLDGLLPNLQVIIHPDDPLPGICIQSFASTPFSSTHPWLITVFDF